MASESDAARARLRDALLNATSFIDASLLRREQSAELLRCWEDLRRSSCYEAAQRLTTLQRELYEVPKEFLAPQCLVWLPERFKNVEEFWTADDLMDRNAHLKLLNCTSDNGPSCRTLVVYTQTEAEQYASRDTCMVIKFDGALEGKPPPTSASLQKLLQELIAPHMVREMQGDGQNMAVDANQVILSISVGPQCALHYSLPHEILDKALLRSLVVHLPRLLLLPLSMVDCIAAAVSHPPPEVPLPQKNTRARNVSSKPAPSPAPETFVFAPPSSSLASAFSSSSPSFSFAPPSAAQPAAGFSFAVSQQPPTFNLTATPSFLSTSSPASSPANIAPPLSAAASSSTSNIAPPSSPTRFTFGASAPFSFPLATPNTQSPAAAASLPTMPTYSSSTLATAFQSSWSPQDLDRPLSSELVALLTELGLEQHAELFRKARADFPALGSIGSAHGLVASVKIPLPDRVRFLERLVAYLASNPQKATLLDLAPASPLAAQASPTSLPVSPVRPPASPTSSVAEPEAAPPRAPASYVHWVLHSGNSTVPRGNYLTAFLMFGARLGVLPYIFMLHQRYGNRNEEDDASLFIDVCSLPFVMWHVRARIGANFEAILMSDDHRDALFAYQLQGLREAPHACPVCRANTPDAKKNSFIAAACMPCRPSALRRKAAIPVIVTPASVSNPVPPSTPPSSSSSSASSEAASSSSSASPSAKVVTSGSLALQSQKEEKHAVDDLVARATLGNSFAQFELGTRYEQGKGFPKDLRTAVKWFRLAAEQGHGRAQIHLGYCLERGLGCLRDNDACIRWYKLAADQSIAIGQRNYAIKIQHQNPVEAVTYMRKAAELGEPEAMCDMGLYLGYGKGGPVDKPQAEMWFEKAMHLGNVRAYVELAKLKESESNPDWKRIVQLSREAAIQRNPKGLYMLGKCYALGRGVETNYRLALEHFETAYKDHKIPFGLAIAGLYFKYGYGNFDNAIAKLTGAATANQAKAAYKLGVLYMQGWKDLLPPDEMKGIFWLQKASSQDWTAARIELALCYEKGVGVAKNRPEALNLWTSMTVMAQYYPVIAERVECSDTELRKIV